MANSYHNSTGFSSHWYEQMISWANKHLRAIAREQQQIEKAQNKQVTQYSNFSCKTGFVAGKSGYVPKKAAPVEVAPAKGKDKKEKATKKK